MGFEVRDLYNTYKITCIVVCLRETSFEGVWVKLERLKEIRP